MSADNTKKTILAKSDSFMDAYVKLPRNIQEKVNEFCKKFRLNPQATGINYEKVRNALDDKIFSVRIDDTYRAIIARQENSGVHLLLWVDRHDDAYQWATRKKCEVNSETGVIQLYTVQETVIYHDVTKPKLFSNIKDDNLKKIGVPTDLVSFIKNFENETDLQNHKSALPADVYEALEYLASGFTIEDILEAYPENKSLFIEDMAYALENDRSKSSFYVIENEEELQKALQYPLDKWRIFLHPTQRKLIESDYAGPCRISGGAGTGKTVVVMHRAKWLAKRLQADEKILITTFSKNLANNIKNNLQKICNSSQEMNKIEVINLDAWVGKFLKQNDSKLKIEYGEVIDNLWETAYKLSDENIDLPLSFFKEEWTKVILPKEIFDKDAYVNTNRIGSGLRLDKITKIKIWNVIEKYLILMDARKIADFDSALYFARRLLEQQPSKTYKSVIVDEGQDFDTGAYKLLRVLAGKEHNNDMFIVGDTHQRIYKKKVVLSNCGINIRGRSHNLKVNYRTTEEIRKFAFSILKDMSFDNMDDEYNTNDNCLSLTHGEAPIVKNFKTPEEEYQYIINEINKLAKSGVQLCDICLVARKNKLIDEYKKVLKSKEIKVYELKENFDDRSFDGVRLATMHRVKGIEFQYIFVVSANEGILPPASVVNISDSTAKAENITSEKCLLYVALTRAQKMAYVTGYGKMSEYVTC